ncbi:MAG: hypothetical protein ACR2PL_19815 [Dehalococcoidia bacterium]
MPKGRSNKNRARARELDPSAGRGASETEELHLKRHIKSRLFLLFELAIEGVTAIGLFAIKQIVTEALKRLAHASELPKAIIMLDDFTFGLSVFGFAALALRSLAELVWEQMPESFRRKMRKRHGPWWRLIGDASNWYP